MPLTHRTPPAIEKKVVALYNTGLSCRAVALEVCLGSSTVERILKRYGVKCRARTEAFKLFVERNGSWSTKPK